MSQALSTTITSYIFSNQKEREKMIESTLHVCLYKEVIIRFDETDGRFWSFSNTCKVVIPLLEVRKFPEVKAFGIKLGTFKKK